MERLRSIEDFTLMVDRIVTDRDPGIPTIVIPSGTCGQASGSNDLIRITKRELLSRRLAERIQLRITGCHGSCQMEPSVLIEPRGTFYPKVGLTEMARIVAAVSETGYWKNCFIWIPIRAAASNCREISLSLNVSSEPFLPRTRRSTRSASFTTLKTRAIWRLPRYWSAAIRAGLSRRLRRRVSGGAAVQDSPPA